MNTPLQQISLLNERCTRLEDKIDDLEARNEYLESLIRENATVIAEIYNR